MFILFEIANLRKSPDSFRNMDCMGYAVTEDDAMEWVEQSPEYRAYKYCPSIQADRMFLHKTD